MSNNDYKDEVKLEVDEVVEVVEKYEGGTTADATIHVDNVNHIITATLNTSGTESFPTIEDLISAVNSKTNDQYKIGTELLVGASGVPDFWVYAVSDTYNSYNFTTLQDLVDEIRTNGHVQVGYYLLAINETDLSGYVSKSDFTTILSETLPELGTSKNKLYLLGGEKTDQITVSVDEKTQIVTINGTVSSFTNLSDLIQIKPYTCINGKTYNFSYHYISGEGSLSSIKLYEKSAGLWSNVFNISITAGNQNKSFSSDKLYDTIGLGVTGTYNNFKFKLQLEEGEVAHDWEMPNISDKVVFKTDMEDYVEQKINNIDAYTKSQSNNKFATKNELSSVESIAKGSQQAVAYDNYEAMVISFNEFNDTVYEVGQNVLIKTLNVPDLWVSQKDVENIPFTYTTDEEIVTQLTNNGSIRVGHYSLSALETGKVNIENMVTTDTQQTISGTKTFDKIFLNGKGSNSNNIVVTNNDTGSDNYFSVTVVGADNTGVVHDTTIFGSNSQGSYQSTGVGSGTIARDYGVALGYNARADAYKSIQLGMGTNQNSNTFQVFNYQMLDANGKIPAERLPETSGGSASGERPTAYIRDAQQTFTTEEDVASGYTFISASNFQATTLTSQDRLVEYGELGESGRKWIRILYPTSITNSAEYGYEATCSVWWYMIEPETSSGGGSGVPANMVTTDTEQTITGNKTFKHINFTQGVCLNTFIPDSVSEFSVGIGTNSQAHYDGVVSIGFSSISEGNNSTSIGNNSSAKQTAVALGYNAKASAEGAIQLGSGTNTEEGTFKVKKYTLLDANGQIPAERLTNILGDINTLLTTLNSGEGV